MRAIETWTVLLTLALLTPSRGFAQAPVVERGGPSASPAQRAALQKLASSDEATVQAGIDELKAQGGVAAQQALIARLRGGLPPRLVESTIDALVGLKATAAGPALTELMQHRRSAIRSKALVARTALEPRGSPALEKTAIAALEDPALEVRSAAVEVLLGMRDHAAVPALLAAYDRGLAAALPAIGELAGPQSIDALLARAVDGVVDPLAPALDGMLGRADFPLSSKLALVTKLVRLGSPSARRYLIGLERSKTRSEPRLGQALAEALKDAPAQVAAAPPAATPSAAAPAPAAPKPAASTQAAAAPSAPIEAAPTPPAAAQPTPSQPAAAAPAAVAVRGGSL